MAALHATFFTLLNPGDHAIVYNVVYREHGLIRLAIGLESSADLIVDLDAALTTAFGSTRD